MMEIMLSHDYLRELAIHYPDLLGGKDFETVLCNGLYRAYRKIVRLVRVFIKRCTISDFHNSMAIWHLCMQMLRYGRSFHFSGRAGRRKLSSLLMYYRDNM